MNDLKKISQTTQKLKRLRQACTVCRRKKTKCDGTKPHCNNCVRLNQECSYVESAKKQSRQKGHINIEQRLLKVETLLNRSNSAEPELELSAQPSTDISESSFSSLNFDKPFNSAPSYGSIEDINQILLISPNNPFSNEEENLIEAWENVILPPLEEILHLANMFLVNLQHFIPSDFRDALLRNIHSRRCSDFYILSICAISARMALNLGLNTEVILEHNIGEVISIEKWNEYETRRKVFWSVFVHDKISSFSTGRPSAIPPEDCDILLSSEDDILKNDRFFIETLDSGVGVSFVVHRDHYGVPVGVAISEIFNSPKERPMKQYYKQNNWRAQFMRMIDILGKINNFINRDTHKNIILGFTDPESVFSQLDLQLERWMQQLPLNMKNTAANFERVRSENTIHNILFIITHIMYNSMIICVHRPIVVLSEAFADDIIQHEMRDGIQASIEKCKAASDNVTLMLREINMHIDRMPPYLACLTYAMVTNIIKDCFSKNPHEVEKAKAALNEHFRMLQTLRNYWAMTDKIYIMIRDVYSIHASMSKNEKRISTQSEKQAPILEKKSGTDWSDPGLDINVSAPQPEISQLFGAHPSECVISTRSVNDLNTIQLDANHSALSSLQQNVWDFSPADFSLLPVDWTILFNFQNTDESQLYATMQTIEAPGNQFDPSFHVQTTEQNEPRMNSVETFTLGWPSQ
ncbi:hypothetical protein BDF14DRAFT_1877458 [Spinellus fusiger]|nr:hypothetical protein BDF14DRAFT_1877458 [Spinellus fusiger]